MSSGPAPPDEQEGRRLLTDELTKPEYNRPEDLLTRALDWLFEQLNGLLLVLPGSSWLSSILIAAVVAIAVVSGIFAARGRLRSSALRPDALGSVLEDAHLSAEDYRRRAEQAVRSGDWDTVLLDSYRALTASAFERTLLDDAPTRTAYEVAVSLEPVFPDQARDLRAAAAGFDKVRYGEQSCRQSEALEVRDLDQSLARGRPAQAWSTP